MLLYIHLEPDQELELDPAECLLEFPVVFILLNNFKTSDHVEVSEQEPQEILESSLLPLKHQILVHNIGSFLSKFFPSYKLFL